MTDLAAHIRDIPDFPKPGILFKDITPLLLDAEALSQAVSELADWARPLDVEFVVAAEARGFILGERAWSPHSVSSPLDGAWSYSLPSGDHLPQGNAIASARSITIARPGPTWRYPPWPGQAT